MCQLLTQTDNLTTASEETIGNKQQILISLLYFRVSFPPASVRSRLHGLCDGDPEEALLGIKDFFGVTDFKEGRRE